MDKLVHSHEDYYTYPNRDMYFRLNNKYKNSLLFIDDDWETIVVCDKDLNVLHEITGKIHGIIWTNEDFEN